MRVKSLISEPARSRSRTVASRSWSAAMSRATSACSRRETRQSVSVRLSSRVMRSLVSVMVSPDRPSVPRAHPVAIRRDASGGAPLPGFSQGARDPLPHRCDQGLPETGPLAGGRGRRAGRSSSIVEPPRPEAYHGSAAVEPQMRARSSLRGASTALRRDARRLRPPRPARWPASKAALVAGRDEAGRRPRGRTRTRSSTPQRPGPRRPWAPRGAGGLPGRIAARRAAARNAGGAPSERRP